MLYYRWFLVGDITVFRMTAKNTDLSKSRLLSNPGYYTIYQRIHLLKCMSQCQSSWKFIFSYDHTTSGFQCPSVYRQTRYTAKLPTAQKVYMHIFRRIFLSNYWWQESDVWSQASYRYAILLCIKINKVGKQEVGIWWVQ
jgi:hypothetical protein